MLEHTVQISNKELSESRDPVALLYERLLDSGCPVATNGSLDPGNEGFGSWTVDGQYLCLSWGDSDD